MSQTHTNSRILTPIALVRLALGWGAVVVLALSGPLLEPPVATPLLVSALAVIIGVIVLCSFGVVKEAEQLAHRLGDPYGTLVLTLSIVLIEVVLISAVMLGPGEHTTIARDSVMAVSMIILNAVVGASLLVGGLRHGDLRINRTGTSSYLALLIPLLAVALVLPVMIGQGGAYTGGQAITVIVLTLALYACFLVRQMGVQAGDFREVTVVPPSGAVGVTATSRPAIRTVIAEHRSEILARVGLLVATVLPIVLLSHDMSALLDDGLGRTGAPVALTGLLIAVIVFLPESITSVRAALAGEAQRVVNLCHGALVSTVGLTIPAVLVIGMLTGQQVVLAESAANLVMLGVTLLLSVTTLAARRVTALHGAAHLVVFAVYVLVLFS
ncbi:calcium:proton antiporter [Micrococcus terreus]|uniref:calcium:proton antiporter n=1 Tax=Micrococcus terreus TaxID=574650 RepID=UPI0021A31846|nr:calcium:proton antiporter [Micrococcus terreus]MCT2087801.1 calcium:proton antiporter [Micrococcus terreus]